MREQIRIKLQIADGQADSDKLEAMVKHWSQQMSAAITLFLAVLFTRVMTLTNVLVLKNNIDVMRELFGVLRGRRKDFFTEI